MILLTFRKICSTFISSSTILRFFNALPKIHLGYRFLSRSRLLFTKCRRMLLPTNDVVKFRRLDFSEFKWVLVLTGVNCQFKISPYQNPPFPRRAVPGVNFTLYLRKKNRKKIVRALASFHTSYTKFKNSSIIHQVNTEQNHNTVVCLCVINTSLLFSVKFLRLRNPYLSLLLLQSSADKGSFL